MMKIRTYTVNSSLINIHVYRFILEQITYTKGGLYMDKQDNIDVKTPSQLIDERIEELGDWRGQLLSKLRGIIKVVDPDVVEEWKWRGTPVWYHDGMICTGETYKSAVKMTFAKGAMLQDPKHIFNASLDGNTRRAIDFHEGDQIDGEGLKALIQEAINLNISTKKPNKKG